MIIYSKGENMNPILITALTVCLSVLIAGAHLLTVFSRSVGRWATFFNIPAHIAALALLLLGGMELSLAALFIMASLTFYLVLSFIKEKIGKDGEGKL